MNFKNKVEKLEKKGNLTCSTSQYQIDKQPINGMLISFEALD